MGVKGRHKSMDKDTKRSVKWLLGQPYVKKVVLGVYANCRHRYSDGHLEVKRELPVGLQVVAYGADGLTKLTVSVEPLEKRDEVKGAIVRRYANE
jgi:hypothetical protein